LIAEIIRLEFKNYIRDNFLLDEQQGEYLDNIDEVTTNYFGSQCSICIIHRLPIELIYPLPVNPEFTKWTVASNNIVVSTDGNGRSKTSGSLTFTIIYQA
jgi:hypothetical protein